jgi:hypothetical protein
MKQRTLFAFCVILGCSGFVTAQSRTVTNADLEKYRQERLKNERDYLENYKSLGLPAPEELERRREQSRLESIELSARLRTERLERERIDAERTASEWRSVSDSHYPAPPDDRYAPSFYTPPYFYSAGYFPRRGFRRPYVQPGYYAGGTFIPTGPSTRPRPMLIQVRGPRPRR